MPVEGQWERQNTPLRRVTRRERRVLACACVAMIALAVAIGLGAARSGPAAKPAAGCVQLVAASTTGGATYRACGAAAERWCREAGATDLAGSLRARCLAAGLPVGVSRPRGPS